MAERLVMSTLLEAWCGSCVTPDVCCTVPVFENAAQTEGGVELNQCVSSYFKRGFSNHSKTKIDRMTDKWNEWLIDEVND